MIEVSLLTFIAVPKPHSYRLLLKLCTFCSSLLTRSVFDTAAECLLKINFSSSPWSRILLHFENHNKLMDREKQPKTCLKSFCKRVETILIGFLSLWMSQFDDTHLSFGITCASKRASKTVLHNVWLTNYGYPAWMLWTVSIYGILCFDDKWHFLFQACCG